MPSVYRSSPGVGPVLEISTLMMDGIPKALSGWVGSLWRGEERYAGRESYRLSNPAKVINDIAFVDSSAVSVMRLLTLRYLMMKVSDN